MRPKKGVADPHRHPLLGLRIDPELVKRGKKASIDYDLPFYEWVEELIKRELAEERILKELSQKRRGRT